MRRAAWTMRQLYISDEKSMSTVKGECTIQPSLHVESLNIIGARRASGKVDKSYCPTLQAPPRAALITR